MSMMIFEKSTVFNPSDYGLNVGDIIQVVCVGGGAGGSSGAGAGGAAGEGGKSCTYTYEDTNPSSGKVYDRISYKYTQNPGGGGSGRGYGAGGGGGGGGIIAVDHSTSYAYNYRTSFTYVKGGSGGGAGEVKVATVLITSLDAIIITIGAGGNADMDGAATSFGTFLTAEGGSVDGGAVLASGDSGYISTEYSSNTGVRWTDDTPEKLSFSGGGGGEGGYIVGLPLGGKFDHNRDQTHAVGAQGNTGGNGLSAACTIDTGSEADYLNFHGLTIDAPETVTESTVVERGGCGGAYTDGESVGIGHGVCIVTW